ncbi:unnamed protein product [Lathyrus sativus]|nr:unnamed protein product [Lathyrus sativus]
MESCYSRDWNLDRAWQKLFELDDLISLIRSNQLAGRNWLDEGAEVAQVTSFKGCIDDIKVSGTMLSCFLRSEISNANCNLGNLTRPQTFWKFKRSLWTFRRFAGLQKFVV